MIWEIEYDSINNTKLYNLKNSSKKWINNNIKKTGKKRKKK